MRLGYAKMFFMKNSLILVFCSVVLLTDVGAMGPAPKTLPVAEVEKKKELVSPSIEGQATMKLRNDFESILNKMELALVPSEKAGEFKIVRDERWRFAASRANFNDGYNNLDLNALGHVAVKYAVKRAKTDEQGLFQFEQVPIGSYVLYGQYKSKYAAAYWLVPIKVSKVGDKIVINLNESNVKEAHNRFD